MKTMVRFSAVLALVAFAGCSENQQPLAPQAMDLANHGSAMSLNKTVPFKVSVSGVFARTGESTAELTGGGKASHLGNITYSGMVFNIALTANGFTYDLTETLTDAKGNQLTIQCRQEVSETSSGSGVYESTDDSWTVSGGTGRFSNASGSGSGTTHVDLNANTFTKECSGTITY